MSKCRMCGREYTSGGWNGFCCSGCEQRWNATPAGKARAEQKRGDLLLFTLPFWGPFWLLWKLRKPLVWCCKKTGRICWVVCMNKWCWTIFTGGFSWLGYKLLKYVYEKEH